LPDILWTEELRQFNAGIGRHAAAGMVGHGTLG
jgi:hypothetical protein